MHSWESSVGPVLVAVLDEIFERSVQSGVKRHRWYPAQSLAHLGEIRVVVTNVYCLPFRRKRHHLIPAAAVQADKLFGQILQAYDFFGAQIENLSFRRGV